MNHEFIREYCLAKPSVTESFPFGDDTLVFKLYDKIFLLLNLGEPNTFNVKCEPEKAIIYRTQFDEILPGYHMNKKHWNTVSFTHTLSDDFMLEMIDDSYSLLLQSIPKKNQSNHQ